MDRAIVTRQIFMPRQPQRRIFDLFVFLIENRKRVANRTRSDQVSESPFPNQGTAASAVSNEIDDVNARLFKLREFKCLCDAS